MGPRISTDPRRASAILLAGILLGAGCASANGEATQAGPSGIAGQSVEVICGGPVSDQGCPHHPLAATIDVLRMPSGRRVATVHTDNRGHFRLGLPPGTYKLKAHTASPLIGGEAVTARVLPRQITHTTVIFTPRHPIPVAPSG